jgi:hypothetical protein
VIIGADGEEAPRPGAGERYSDHYSNSVRTCARVGVPQQYEEVRNGRCNGRYPQLIGEYGGPCGQWRLGSTRHSPVKWFRTFRPPIRRRRIVESEGIGSRRGGGRRRPPSLIRSRSNSSAVRPRPRPRADPIRTHGIEGPRRLHRLTVGFPDRDAGVPRERARRPWRRRTGTTWRPSASQRASSGPALAHLRRASGG